MTRLSLMAVLLASGASAQDSPGAAERLELWRHARLGATRQDSVSALAEFTTDGCSGGMSSVWKTIASAFPEFAELHQASPPWEECCVIHDRAYHLGGDDPTPRASYDARLQADEALRQCVVAYSAERNEALKAQYNLSEEQVTWAYETISDRMFDAVRLGGAPCSGLPWRWGYGWPQCW